MLQPKSSKGFYEENRHSQSPSYSAQKLPHSLPTPRLDERPAEYADRVGSWYISQVSAEHRKSHGQYLTPIAVADFMAGLYDTAKSCIRVLDPAAGAGILLCAMVERIVQGNTGRIHKIELAAYEIDKDLAPCLTAVLKYLGDWCTKQGITLDCRMMRDDFILAQSHNLKDKNWLFNSDSNIRYDVVVANPPYFKIGKNDPRAVAASSVVHGQPNIYALFMAVGAAILAESGTLIFITPRSFASGQYFKAFRHKFFSMIKPDLVHVFESRVDAFSRDEILQENIIIKGIRQDSPHSGEVTISCSQGARDIDHSINRSVGLDSILDKAKGDMLRLPVSEEDNQLIDMVDSWPGSLRTYGMNISTGQVVPFRATELLDTSGDVPTTHTPLLWMNHTSAMHTEWPKRTRKPEYIKNAAGERGLLIPNRNYVLLRRFSAKEEKRRLTAAPYLAEHFSTPLIAFENHLNYIHRPDGALTREEALGLAALLNSVVLNRYYRIMNGNTQVGATELRLMPLPPHESIIKIGKAMSKYNGNAEAMLDNVVNEVLGIPAFQQEREEVYA